MVFYFIVASIIITFLYYISKKEGQVLKKKINVYQSLFIIASTVVFSLSISAILFHVLKNSLDGVSEFVTGGVVLDAVSKNRDYYSLISFVIFSSILLPVMKIFLDRILDDDEKNEAFNEISPFILIPSVLFLTQSLFLNNLGLILIISSITIFIFLFDIMILNKIKLIHDKENCYINELKALIATDILIFVGASSFRLLLYRFFDIESSYLFSFVLLFVVKCFVIVINGFLSNKKFFNHFFILLQVLNVSGLIILINPEIDEQYTLRLLVGGLIFIGYYFIYKNREKDSGFHINSYLAFILLFIFIARFFYTPYISADEYHSGEYYLPFWLLKNYGKLPFIDFQPARGLLNYFPGFLSSLFCRIHCL